MAELDGFHIPDYAKEWLDTILSQQGNPCGNCGTWRPLKEREITFCAMCGDDPIDIYELAESATDLPATKSEPTKESLIADAQRIIKNINRIFTEVRYWNERVRPRLYPDEQPIDPDPDGQLAAGRAAAQKTLDQFTALSLVPKQEPGKDFEM